MHYRGRVVIKIYLFFETVKLLKFHFDLPHIMIFYDIQVLTNIYYFELPKIFEYFSCQTYKIAIILTILFK